MPSMPLLAPHRRRPSVEQCRSVDLWQGDLAEFKERDTKTWVAFHELETFTAKRNETTHWGVKLRQPCTQPIETVPGLCGGIG